MEAVIVLFVARIFMMIWMQICGLNMLLPDVLIVEQK
jgi:hypothetical protein